MRHALHLLLLLGIVLGACGTFVCGGKLVGGLLRAFVTSGLDDDGRALPRLIHTAGFLALWTLARHLALNLH